MLQIEIQRRKKATVGTVQRILWFGGDANHRAKEELILDSATLALVKKLCQ